VLVKYNTKSIAGFTAPNPTTVHYTWVTQLDHVTQPGTPAGVDLKLSGTQLAPSAGSGVGVTSLTEQQLQPVVDEAIALWSAAGLSPAQINVLRNTPIHIATFLDAPRLGVESDGEIWLNANAAGWGWFTDASAGATPAVGQMDLLTVVEHEFGHVLFGVQDGSGLMEATLAPGVRLVPETLSSTGNVVGAGATASGALVQGGATGVAQTGVPLAASARTDALDTAFAPSMGGSTQPAAGATLPDQVGTLNSLARSLLNLGSQIPAVLSAATTDPAAVATMSHRETPNVSVPGFWPPARSVERARANEVLPSEDLPSEDLPSEDLPSDEAQDDDPTAWPPRTDPDAEARVGLLFQPQACDSCFADGSWMTNLERLDVTSLWDDTESSGHALDAVAPALAVVLGGWWGARRFETEERRRRFVI
jgi:hypothetical protein